MALSQVIPFVHSGLAVAALATGVIPLLIHLINRRRYRQVTWAAMTFLLAAHRRSTTRIRLEHWLLMVTRMALIVVLGLSVARPFIRSTHLPTLGSAPAHRVLLLDNSLSMNAREAEGRSRFEEARAYAEHLIASMPVSDSISLVTVAEPAETVIGHAAQDRRIIRERLAAVRLTQRPADTAGALRLARNILRDSPAAAGNRAVYLISDMRRRVWLGDAPSVNSAMNRTPTSAVLALRQLADELTDSGVDLNLIGVGADTGANLAVTRLATESALLVPNIPIRAVVEVTNFGQSSARNVVVQLRSDGRIVRQETIAVIPPWGSAGTTMSLEFAGAGTHPVEARIHSSTPDPLPDDDARYLSLELRDRIPVLLVDGQPGTTLLTGQAGFAATALGLSTSAGGPDHAFAADPSRRTVVEPKLISGVELDAEAFTEFDVIILCNVQRLSPAHWEQLHGFVSRGGGLAIFGGDLINVEHYNRFGYAEGSGMLPGKLAPAVTLAAESGNGFTLDDHAHPITAEFTHHPESGLFLARVERYLPMQVDAGRGDIVLRYTNSEPAWVASRVGKGGVVFCTTTANMDWNNLPAKGDYVSLMVSLVSFLSPDRGSHRNLLVGQTLQERLLPRQVSLPLRVMTNDGSSFEGRLVPEEGALAMAYGPLERAGMAIATIGPEVRHFSANLDPAGSDLESVDEKTLAAVLERPVRFAHASTMVTPPSVTGRSRELGFLGFYTVIGLLFVEMFMAMRFGLQKTAPSTGGERYR